jgi:integrase
MTKPGFGTLQAARQDGRARGRGPAGHEDDAPHKPEDEQWRDIPLPASTAAMLRGLPTRIDTPLTFTTPTGKVWRERNWRRDVWAPTCKATGMNPRPQEFRASWESILAAAGIDRADLAQYAGHSVATANSHYVQPLDRSAERVRSVIG